MEGLMSIFHIDWKLMIAQLINFVLVFLALYFLVVKPLKKITENRTKEITEGLLNSKKNKEILENTKKDYEEVILKAKNEANIILNDTKKEAEKTKFEIIENTKKEVEKMIENGKISLENEKTKMINEAKKDVVSLIIKVSEKIIGNKNEDYEKSIIKELNNL